MKISQKMRVFIVLITPLCLSLLVYFSIHKPDINFIANKNYVIHNFTDKDDKGNSTCNFKFINNQIQVAYSLNTGYDYPYAGLLIQHSNESLFNVEDYILNLIIDAKQDFRISLRMNQFLENYTDSANPLSFLFLVKSLGFKKGINNLQIRTKDINEIPDWWFKRNPKKANNFKSVSLKNTRDIWLFSDYSTPLNKEILFNVTTLKLTYDFYPFLYWTILCLILYYVILFVLWKFKNEKIKYIFLPIEATKVKDNSQNIKNEILVFIGTNYSNPDLRMSDLNKELGVNEDKVNEIIKTYSNKSFRQYLNQIRMEEAKRLLKETHLNIAEIAFKVGYNNITHFNRVFKEYTSETPKTYREL